ncbi:RNA polymerase sigma factor, sigma-70 family protein [Anoxybacillus sp. B7M1]|jgi:RNA polymerase sigma factor (sigma-70 family)|uniref:sigma-70 family RNA polymerase sigma factor n=1 Tax=unclassified Anoxybacillus TaxID=2639704 RepID=UPI0005CD2023|nr:MULTISPECIES: sigma-70 family RNA polymerase sigma factor [unclassified Anoxybacillus]ANB57762.1 RNA polymerase sigma factor, sigma-70 family protein [Anoxybacillus sp. B2M1]ANB63964.1 RNA polymerase sigma factor, sigma-70 family protein [Anoxybacillus sp. B7M1]
MSSFAKLEKTYRPMIISMIKKLHVTKEWDEYYQIGLIALWEASCQFEKEKGSFSSFVYKKVYWAMVSHLRRQCHRKKRECTLTDGLIHILFDDRTIYKEGIVEQALKSLTERQKKWLIGYIIEGKSLKAIAEEEGVAVGTVKQWRVEALKKLRKQRWE